MFSSPEPEDQVIFSDQKVSVLLFDFFFKIIACPFTKLTTNVSLEVLKKCCIFSDRKSQLATFGLLSTSTFVFLLQNDCLRSHQTCQKCSSMGSEKLLLVGAFEIQYEHIGFLLAKLFSTSFKLCTVLEVIFANFRQGLVTSHAVVL